MVSMSNLLYLNQANRGRVSNRLSIPTSSSANCLKASTRLSMFTHRPCSDGPTSVEDGNVQVSSASPRNYQYEDGAPSSSRSTILISPRLHLTSSYSHFELWPSSTCSPSFSHPLQGATSSASTGTLTGHPDSAHVEHTPGTQEQYEIYLLTYYRYQIAPSLDLGI